MAAAAPPPPVFTVRRSEPVLVAPADPTPGGAKRLSVIDSQKGLRFVAPLILYYRDEPSMRGRDPASVVRDALAKALVDYYPLAGRVREEADGRLVVDCTAEGVLFVEADADVGLDDFGDRLPPPVPCLDQLLSGSTDVMGAPLLSIQVTRLRCGGFILALLFNHGIFDADGLIVFMTAVGDLARGRAAVPAVWDRELLDARDPPQVTHAHPEFDELPPAAPPGRGGAMQRRSFFFGPKQIAAVRALLPVALSALASDNEVLASWAWRARTVALGADAAAEVRFLRIVNARARYEPPLPAGYYGNAFAYGVAVSTAGELCGGPLERAVELVRAAEARVTDGHMRSLADLLAIRGGPRHATAGLEATFLIPDATGHCFGGIEFGWGSPAYGGPAGGALEGTTFLVQFVNGKGEDGVVLPVYLPGDAMARFEQEFEMVAAVGL